MDGLDLKQILVLAVERARRMEGTWKFIEGTMRAVTNWIKLRSSDDIDNLVNQIDKATLNLAPIDDDFYKLGIATVTAYYTITSPPASSSSSSTDNVILEMNSTHSKALPDDDDGGEPYQLIITITSILSFCLYYLILSILLAHKEVDFLLLLDYSFSLFLSLFSLSLPLSLSLSLSI
jgi:hypothetical protein